MPVIDPDRQVDTDNPSLHPNNHRPGTDLGLDLAEWRNYRRRPAVYVTESGEEKHESPMCPNVQGNVHYAMCREDALYTYGERWCEVCHGHRDRVDFPAEAASDD